MNKMLIISPNLKRVEYNKLLLWLKCVWPNLVKQTFLSVKLITYSRQESTPVKTWDDYNCKTGNIFVKISATIFSVGTLSMEIASTYILFGIRWCFVSMFLLFLCINRFSQTWYNYSCPSQLLLVASVECQNHLFEILYFLAHDLLQSCPGILLMIDKDHPSPDFDIPADCCALVCSNTSLISCGLQFHIGVRHFPPHKIY